MLRKSLFMIVIKHSMKQFISKGKCFIDIYLHIGDNTRNMKKLSYNPMEIKSYSKQNECRW